MPRVRWEFPTSALLRLMPKDKPIGPGWITTTCATGGRRHRHDRRAKLELVAVVNVNGTFQNVAD
jgi:hypothetical protein